jgi:hypothetical protein
MIIYIITVFAFGSLFLIPLDSRESKYSILAFVCSLVISIIWYNHKTSIEEENLRLETELLN